MSAKGSTLAWQRLQLADFGKPAASAAIADEQPAKATGREEEHSEGFMRGYNEGLSAGRMEGFAAGEAAGMAEGQQAAHQLLDLAAKLDETLTEADREIAGEVLALALEIARQIVRQTVDIKPDTVLPVIREALGQLPQHHASIQLHPDDAALLRKHAGDQINHGGHRILEDPQLQRGDVVVEASGAQVDATLATRWRRVVESLGSKTPWIDDEKS